MNIKTNFARLAGLSLFSLLVACGGEDNSVAKAKLEANRPAWVPKNSTLMYGVDGSNWASCSWEEALYHCSFYEIGRDARVKQSYKLCEAKTSAILLERPADNGLVKYDTNGIVLVPVTPLVYYKGNEIDQRRSKLAEEEFHSLEIYECGRKFFPFAESE